MSRITVHLKHELDENARAMCQEYWRREETLGLSWSVTLGQLAEQFGLTQHVLARIARENSYGTDEALVCSACGSPHRCTGRTDFDRRRSLRPHACDVCLQSASEAEEARRREDEAAKRYLLDAVLGSQKRPPVNVSELSLRASVYLLAASRASPSEDLGVIGPGTGALPIAPSPRTSSAVLTYLNEIGILHVDHRSPVDAFDWQSGNPINKFDLSRVAWRIAPDECGEPLVAVLQDKLRSHTWNPSWTGDVAELWREIVLEEAIEFLLFSLDDHQLAFSPGEKTSMVLAAALENYSLARVWGVIWRAAKDAAAARARGVERWKAAAWTITSIQAYMERAVTQKWDLKPYRRHWRAPQSTLSQVFFDGLLALPRYEDERPRLAPPRHAEVAPIEPLDVPTP